ncbi:MAG: lysylphosphatidylglycerol synthase transmembrane domain-containing protein, partial [Chloroflexota bacterium]
MTTIEQTASLPLRDTTRRRQLVSGVVYLLLTLLAVYVVVPQFLGRDSDQVWPLLQQVRPEFLALLILCETIRYVCFGLVARQLAFMLGRPIARRDTFQMMLGSYALSRIFSLGGATAFIVRLQFYFRNGLTFGRALSLFIMHNVVSGAALMLTYLFGVSVLWQRGELEGVRLLAAFGWLCVVVIVAVGQLVVGLRPGFVERALQQVVASVRASAPRIQRWSAPLGMFVTIGLLVLCVFWLQGAAAIVEQAAASAVLLVLVGALAAQLVVWLNPRAGETWQQRWGARAQRLIAARMARQTLSHHLAADLSDGAHMLVRQPRGVLLAWGFQALGLAADIATLVIAVLALQAPLSPALVVAAYIVAYYAQLIAPTPGEAGAMEFALLGVLVFLGLSPLQATTVTLLFRFVSFWLPIPFGVAAYANLKRQGKV